MCLSHRQAKSKIYMSELNFYSCTCPWQLDMICYTPQIRQVSQFQINPISLQLFQWPFWRNWWFADPYSWTYNVLIKYIFIFNLSELENGIQVTLNLHCKISWPKSISTVKRFYSLNQVKQYLTSCQLPRILENTPYISSVKVTI